MLLIYSWIEFRSVQVVHNYLNFSIISKDLISIFMTHMTMYLVLSALHSSPKTIAGHCRWMYLMPNTSESHTLLHFRGKFLPVSWAHKVLFCTLKFPCIFEILPDRKIQYTYLNSAQKVPLSSSTEVRGTKKKLNYVDQCHFHCIWS